MRGSHSTPRANGDEGSSLARLLPNVYEDLRRLARSYMRRERPGHTLQPTALVHEAYVRLTGTDVDWQDRTQLFKAAAQAMKRVLIDHARARAAIKRDGSACSARSAAAEAAETWRRGTATTLHELLAELGHEHRRAAHAIRLYYFEGLSHEAIARETGISPATVDRDLRLARIWLHHALRR